MISHDAALELISARLDAPLSLTQSRELQAHLATCAGCRQFAEQVEILAGELRAFPRLAPSPAVSRGVMERIGAGRSPWGGLTRGLRLASSPVTAVASGFVLVAALAITVLLALNPPGEGRLDAPPATRIGVAFASTATATATATMTASPSPAPTSTSVTPASAMAATEAPTSTPTPTAQTNVRVTVVPTSTPGSAPVAPTATAMATAVVRSAAEPTAVTEAVVEPTALATDTPEPSLVPEPTEVVPTAPAPTAIPAATEVPTPTESPAVVIVRTPRAPVIPTPRPPNTPIPPALPVVIDSDVAVADVRDATIASAVPPSMAEAVSDVAPTPLPISESDAPSPRIVPRDGQAAVENEPVNEAVVIPDSGVVAAATTVDGDGTISVGDDGESRAPESIEVAAANADTRSVATGAGVAEEPVSVAAAAPAIPTATPEFGAASPVPATGFELETTAGGVRIGGDNPATSGEFTTREDDEE